MTEISKFLSKDIGDLSKLFGIEKGNLTKVLKTDVPSVEQWVEYFGLSYWSCAGNCLWDGDSYNVNGPGLQIIPIGTWHQGFRPSKIRITATHNLPGGASWTLILGDGVSGIATLEIPNGSHQVAEADITWDGNDITRLLDPNAPAVGQIENIEFLE